MNEKLKVLNLLPRKYRVLGYSFIILAVLLAVLYKIEIIDYGKNITKLMAELMILLGLLILMLIKGKTEDEMLQQIRLKAITAAFIFGVGYYIIMPFINLLFDGVFENLIGTFQLLILMFFMYFIWFYLMKKRVNEK